MATPMRPLRKLTHQLPLLSLQSSSFTHHHRSFTSTAARPVRERSKPENSRGLRALAAEAEQFFSMEQSSADLQSMPGMQEMTPRETEQIQPESTAGPPPYGFFAFGARGEDNMPDYETDTDDISATAHGELEQVREVRELDRAQAWDGPMLFEHAKPFQPPSEKTPLRFRYTTYLGETHGGSRKVVLEFSPQKLPNLTPQQTNKLIKLLGTRYDPHTRTAKMSCDRYPTAPQNKSSLVETLEKLLKETREGKDTLEDIPFDFRHARFEKEKPRFPKEWKLSEERKRYLEERWQKAREQEGAREVEGQVVDGKRLIGVPLEAASEEPEMVVASRRRKR